MNLFRVRSVLPTTCSVSYLSVSELEDLQGGLTRSTFSMSETNPKPRVHSSTLEHFIDFNEIKLLPLSLEWRWGWIAWLLNMRRIWLMIIRIQEHSQLFDDPCTTAVAGLVKMTAADWVTISTEAGVVNLSAVVIEGTMINIITVTCTIATTTDDCCIRTFVEAKSLLQKTAELRQCMAHQLHLHSLLLLTYVKANRLQVKKCYALENQKAFVTHCVTVARPSVYIYCTYRHKGLPNMHVQGLRTHPWIEQPVRINVFSNRPFISHWVGTSSNVDLLTNTWRRRIKWTDKLVAFSSKQQLQSYEIWVSLKRNWILTPHMPAWNYTGRPCRLYR